MMTSRETMQGDCSPSAVEELKPLTIMGDIYGLFQPLALLAGMRLDLFTPLKGGALTAGELALALGVREDKLQPVLYPLLVAGLLKMENEKFANSEEAAKFLVRGEPDYIGGLGDFYSALADMSLKTAESVRTGRPQAKHDFDSLPDDQLSAYFQKQIHSSLKAGREIAERIDFSEFGRILDAGGGSGGVSIAVCSRHPHLKATVADLPRVAALAERFIGEAGLSGRIAASAVDLCSGPPLGRYDAVIVRALIQTLSLDEARLALQNIGRSLCSGGRIFILGNVLDDSRLGPPAALAFGLVFINTYEHGQAYTEKEYRGMLGEAGFGDIAIVHEALSDGLSLVSAVKE